MASTSPSPESSGAKGSDSDRPLGKVKESSSLVASLGVGIAVASLVVALWTHTTQESQLSAQQAQLAAQSAQLSQASEQFRESGYQFDVDVKVGLKPDGAAYQFPIERQIIDTDLSAASVYVLADISNNGRSPGQIKQIGIRGANAAIVPVNHTNCANPKTAELTSCNFPIRIDDQQTASFYLRLDDATKAAVSCFPGGSANEIELALLTSSGEIETRKTGASIYWYDQCPTSTPSAVATTS